MSRKTQQVVASLLIVACVLLAGCGGGGGGGGGASANSPPPPPPVPPSTGTLGDGNLDDLVNYVREKNGMPAMGAIVVSQGQIAESSVSGRRSLNRNRPVTIDDKWHVGSLTKSMTATLVGVFVEQSLMTWDMTPLDVWPEMAAGIRNEYRTATVEQLLSHQAGLPTDVTAIPSFQRVTDIAPGSVVEKRLLWATELLQLAPELAAGNFLYTNAGYIIAGAMMETLSGSSWENLIADQLFGPLAMNETGFGAPGTEGQVDEPWGHRIVNGGLTPIPPGPAADNPAAIGPAGTVHASLEDLARYMQSHINGERGIPGPVTAATFQFLHSPSGGWPYGMGWNVDDSDEGTMGPTLQHGGSNDRWFARIALAPGLNLGLLIVTNAGGTQADQAIDELGDLMIERIQASF